jgi:hypothetical protein
MTSCGDIDLLRDPGPVWEPGFPPIGSFAEHNFYSQLCSSPIWPGLMAREWIVSQTPIENKNELSFKKIVLIC